MADALKARGAWCGFVCRSVPDALAAMIVANGHEVLRLGTGADSTGRVKHGDWLEVPQEEDVRQTLAACAGRSIDWAVVDHYGLDAVWERSVRALASKIMVIDDLANRQHACDVLVDQNLFADADTRYDERIPQQCRRLLGPQYAMLREEFTQRRSHAKVRSGSVRRILVSFGGVDATNRTALALAALTLLDLQDIQVDVVIGDQHPGHAAIADICRRPGFALHVQSAQMAQLMAAADMGIGAGGSATWERCCVGLPTLALAVADNQTQLVRDCALAGALYAPAEPLDADSLSRHVRCLMENPLLRQVMSGNGMRIVDGRGTARILRTLGVIAVAVRPVVSDDARSLFEWRNHPSIREASRSSAPLQWNAHKTWLDAALSDPSRVLLIGESAGRPVGVVRFDVADDTAEVSIYTVPGQGQRGTGADLLAAAEMWLETHKPSVRQIIAEVLGENSRSHSLFAGARYQSRSTSYTKRIQGE